MPRKRQTPDTRSRWLIVACILFGCLGAVKAQEGPAGANEQPPKCGQSLEISSPLIDEAESKEFNTRRVEISGSTYTRDREFRKRMAVGMSEGDIFTRRGLEKSVRKISRMRSIYPITMSDLEIRLDRERNYIDIVFCVKQRPKR